MCLIALEGFRWVSLSQDRKHHGLVKCHIIIIQFIQKKSYNILVKAFHNEIGGTWYKMMVSYEFTLNKFCYSLSKDNVFQKKGFPNEVMIY